MEFPGLIRQRQQILRYGLQFLRRLIDIVSTVFYRTAVAATQMAPRKMTDDTPMHDHKLDEREATGRGARAIGFP